MYKIILIILLSIVVSGKDFKMRDGSILSIINTSYGIIVNNKYKLKFTNTEHIINGEIASIYQNKKYKYSISCEGSFCDVVVTNKYTNKNVDYGTDDLTPDVVCWVYIYKNGKFFDVYSGGYSLDSCHQTANIYNNKKYLKNEGYKYIVRKCKSKCEIPPKVPKSLSRF